MSFQKIVDPLAEITVYEPAIGGEESLGESMSFSDRWTINIVDRRSLFGECLISGLGPLDGDNDYKHYLTLKQCLQNHSRGSRTVILICLNEGRGTAASTLESDIAEIQHVDKHIKFVLVAEQEDPGQILKALDLGAQGVIPMTFPLRVFIEALRLVKAGGLFVPASSMQRLASTSPAKPMAERAEHDVFSPRQISVAKALRKGTPNKTIAYELNMCESTVKVHVRQIMKKLKARNRTEVAFLTNQMFSADV